MLLLEPWLPVDVIHHALSPIVLLRAFAEGRPIPLWLRGCFLILPSSPISTGLWFGVYALGISSCNPPVKLFFGLCDGCFVTLHMSTSILQEMVETVGFRHRGLHCDGSDGCDFPRKGWRKSFHVISLEDLLICLEQTEVFFPIGTLFSEISLGSWSNANEDMIFLSQVLRPIL
jgi:hypothetical protein